MLETGQVDVSLERSVREERFAHVRLVGGWNWGGAATWGAGLGGGGGMGVRMGFKYGPHALREAVFGGAAGGPKRRKLAESAGEGGNHKTDREEESKRQDGGREDVVLLAEGATNERVVFVYRGLRPQIPPPDVDRDKDKNMANSTPAIGSKRPREEEQDDEEYEAVYDVFRERRATGSAPPSTAPATTTTATGTTTSTEGTTAKGVRFAAGSKLADGGCKPRRRQRPGTGSESSNGKIVWRRTLVMRNVCESDVEFGKDGICLWVKVVPPAAVAAAVANTTVTPTLLATTTATTATTSPAPAAPAPAAPASSSGRREKEPRLTRLEVEYDGTPLTVGSKSKKDERRGVIFPCKVWRWRPPPRVTRTPCTQKGEDTKPKGKVEGEEKKMEIEIGMEMEVES